MSLPFSYQWSVAQICWKHERKTRFPCFFERSGFHSNWILVSPKVMTLKHSITHHNRASNPNVHPPSPSTTNPIKHDSWKGDCMYAGLKENLQFMVSWIQNNNINNDNNEKKEKVLSIVFYTTTQRRGKVCIFIQRVGEMGL